MIHLFVINTQTFSELIHELLYLLNILYLRRRQNVLNSTLSMTYENFLEQVNLAEQLTSSDFGV